MRTSGSERSVPGCRGIPPGTFTSVARWPARLALALTPSGAPGPTACESLSICDSQDHFLRNLRQDTTGVVVEESILPESISEPTWDYEVLAGGTSDRDTYEKEWNAFDSHYRPILRQGLIGKLPDPDDI